MGVARLWRYLPRKEGRFSLSEGDWEEKMSRAGMWMWHRNWIMHTGVLRGHLELTAV